MKIKLIKFFSFHFVIYSSLDMFLQICNKIFIFPSTKTKYFDQILYIILHLSFSLFIFHFT